MGCKDGMCSFNPIAAATEDVADNLEKMFEMQRGFQTRLDENVFETDAKGKTAFVKEHSIHLNQEINEMLYELPFFKPWKDYSKMTDEEIAEAFDKAKKEYIDAWHFFMNIGLMLGFDAQMLYKMYVDKNAENHRRQDEGYTHDISYHEN